jgi:hypothetical protein
MPPITMGGIQPQLEITAQTPFLQNDLRNNNHHSLSSVPPFSPSMLSLSSPVCHSPFSIHHQFWKQSMQQNQIPFGMITQTVTIPFHLPCRCSHLLFVHIITPHSLSPLSIHHQFWSMSIHQHQVPSGMNRILLPSRFFCLRFVQIIILC